MQGSGTSWFITKEFPEQLADVGNKLLQIPLLTQELLLMLDQAEAVLRKVDQEPPTEMQSLLTPYKKSLIQAELLHFPATDVRIAATNCICELARITVPELSYDDDKMKEIFKLIVFSMGSLSNPSSRSYPKAINILHIVAVCRLSVVMLDLECTELINEMISLFLTSITSEPPPEVFEDMESIMTRLIEESDDVSNGLFSPIFACLDDRDAKVTPFGRRLGKKVMEKCSLKLLRFKHHLGIKKEQI